MRKIRFTPLNMATATLLIWMGLRFIENQLTLGQAIGAFFLILVVILADQFFRITLRKLGRIWLVEGAFVLLAVAVWLIVLKS